MCLKGIITVSPEEVHNHSVNRLGEGRGEHITVAHTCFLLGCFFFKFHDIATDVRVARQDRLELREGSLKNTLLLLLLLKWRVIFLSPRQLGGHGAHLSVLSEPVGAVRLPDGVIV